MRKEILAVLVGVLVIIGGVWVFRPEFGSLPEVRKTAENKPKFVWKQVWAQELLEMDDSDTASAEASAMNTTLLQCKNVRLQDWRDVASDCDVESSAGQPCSTLGSRCVVAVGGCASVNLHYCEFGMARKGVNAGKPCNHTASDSYAYYLKEELCADNKDLIEKAPWLGQRSSAQGGCMRLVAGLVCAEP